MDIKNHAAIRKARFSCKIDGKTARVFAFK